MDLLPRPSIIAALVLAAATDLPAQIQPMSRVEGHMAPIVSYHLAYTEVLQDGRKRNADTGAYEVRPYPNFGEGFVEIAAVQADLDPLRDASTKERASPNAVRFRYKASLTADRTLANCYGLFTYLTEGSIGTQMVALGRLSKGSSRKVEIELHTRVEKPGTLHVFSEGLEVRTSQHPTAYDFTAFYANLMKDIRGLPAAALLKGEVVYPYRLSYDGRLLASLRDRDANTVLIVYDLESMKLLYDQPVAPVDNFAGGLTWVSDHEVAYVAQEDYRSSEGDHKLFLLDVRTGKTKALLKHTYRIFSQVVDQPEVLILENGGATVKYNVHTGKTSDLESLESGWYYYDRKGNPRVEFYYDGDKRICKFKPTPESRWREIDREVRQPGLHFNLRGSELLDRVVDVHSVGPDGDTLYVSTRLGTDRFELAAFSMSQGVIKQVVAKHPRYDLTPDDEGYSRLLFAKRDAQLLGMIFAAQKLQVVWLDPNYAAVQKAIDRTFPDHVNLPVDWSANGESFVYFSMSDQDPGTYYVFKPRESRLIPLVELGARLKGKTLAKTTPFEFAARDGAKIPAYITRPPPGEKGPVPLIVYIHGGPMARDIWQYDATNQFFASRGYDVLQVNYRGSSGYGAAFQSAGLRARLDTVVLDDIADGVRSLIAQGEVDPARIAVLGASFGGWATYMSLIKYPELYRTGIAISAVSSWRAALSENRWDKDRKLSYTFWKALLSRNNFSEDEKFIDPLVRAGELKQPVLIIHGELDRTVNPREAKLMLDALRKHNPNVQSLSLPYSTHTWWPFADRVALLNESAVFLEQWMGQDHPKAQAMTH